MNRATGSATGFAFLTMLMPAMLQDEGEKLKPEKDRVRETCTF